MIDFFITFDNHKDIIRDSSSIIVVNRMKLGKLRSKLNIIKVIYKFRENMSYYTVI